MDKIKSKEILPDSKRKNPESITVPPVLKALYTCETQLEEVLKTNLQLRAELVALKNVMSRTMSKDNKESFNHLIDTIFNRLSEGIIKKTGRDAGFSTCCHKSHCDCNSKPELSRDEFISQIRKIFEFKIDG